LEASSANGFNYFWPIEAWLKGRFRRIVAGRQRQKSA